MSSTFKRVANELLPCPFCGLPAEIVTAAWTNIDYVRCSNPDCFIRPTTYSGDLDKQFRGLNREQAVARCVEQWQKRSLPIPSLPPPRPCRDCGAQPGELHQEGCDVERCPRCGFQAIGCNCIYIVCDMDPSTLQETHPDIYSQGPTEEMHKKWDETWGKRRLPWSGVFPGLAECREYGLWCVGPPWQSVPPGTPGATEDLNRLYSAGRWDIEQRKFLMPKS